MFLVSIPAKKAKEKTRTHWEGRKSSLSQHQPQPFPTFLHDLLAASCKDNSPGSVVSCQHSHSFASTFSFHLPPISLTCFYFPRWLTTWWNPYICICLLKWPKMASLPPVSYHLNFTSSSTSSFFPLTFDHSSSLFLISLEIFSFTYGDYLEVCCLASAS